MGTFLKTLSSSNFDFNSGKSSLANSFLHEQIETYVIIKIAVATLGGLRGFKILLCDSEITLTKPALTVRDGPVVGGVTPSPHSAILDFQAENLGISINYK